MLWPYVAFVVLGLAFVATYASDGAGEVIFGLFMLIGFVGGLATVVWAIRGTPTFIRNVRKGWDPASWRGER
jgi:hypothetical protein